LYVFSVCLCLAIFFLWGIIATNSCCHSNIWDTYFFISLWITMYPHVYFVVATIFPLKVFIIIFFTQPHSANMLSVSLLNIEITKWFLVHSVGGLSDIDIIGVKSRNKLGSVFLFKSLTVIFLILQ